jgi:hypothetical protein
MQKLSVYAEIPSELGAERRRSLVTGESAPAVAGWYSLPQAAPGAKQVGYWDGAGWTGAQRRASRAGTQPRDSLGWTAMILLCAGFLGTIAVPVIYSSIAAWANYPSSILTVAMFLDFAATPVALVVSIAGLRRAHEQKFKAGLSLITLALSIAGTVLLVLPLSLLITGVWSVHI